MAPEPADRILVVGPSWVGDMVMSQVLYQLLCDTRSSPVIDVLAPAWSGPILQRMPQVNRIIDMPVGHGSLQLGQRRALGRMLATERYSQAIVLPNSLKSALVPFFAGIAQRTGWRGEMRYGLLNDLRRLDPQALPLMIQRFAALGLSPQAQLPDSLPEPHLQIDPQHAQQAREVFSLLPDTPILALCPGAEFGSAKRWPALYYGQLAQVYLARGWQVVLYGSANDAPVCNEIKAQTANHEHCFNLAGKTSLAQAVDLLSLSAAVVSNDSGLMHIAAALQRPLLALYGPTSPDFTPPLSAASRRISSDIDCAPCFARECPLGHHRCLREMTPERVLQALDALLAELR
tara:strand:+ start:248138 stop:249178 length:1041 start_codon:yes stop_codon:yes gene_type:complete